MFQRSVRVASNASRNYATLREIEMRLKSIKNIEKITNTMKIVASTRLGKAQKAMTTSRLYHESDDLFFNTSNTQALTEEEPNVLIVAISSDKGLCGSIHSQLAKATKLKLKEFPNAKVVTVGDKIKAQVLRSHPENVILSFNGVGKEAPTYTEASLITDEITKIADFEKFNKIEILYNKFVSGVSFEPTSFNAYTEQAIDSAENLAVFEIDEDAATKVTASLAQLSLTNAILSGLADGYASEISARRNAMDNASKNAGDMISKFTILYNRTRQAVITNELVDIITGASSLD